MNVLKPSRASFFVVLFGISSLPSCSDDDSPPSEPSFPDAAVSSSSSEGTHSAPASSQSDAGSGESASSSRPAESTSAEDAGASSTTADVTDAGAAAATLLEGLRGDPELATLAELIEKAQIEDELLKEGPFTVLAPSNDGWSRLPDGYLDSLSRKQLETLVRNHLLPQPATVAQLVQAGMGTSVIEFHHQFTESGGEVYVDGLTRITARDATYGGSKVHKVDSVLPVEVFPGTLADAVHAYPRLSELDQRLSDDERALLDEDDKTLFAPINGGFSDAQPTDADAGADAGTVSDLGYHVLPHRLDSDDLSRGGVTPTAVGAYLGLATDASLSITDGRRHSRVLLADLRVESGAQGSVLHVVEEALSPPPSVFEVLRRGAGGETFESLITVTASTIAPGGESFADHLTNAEQVSLFAPSDTAFGRIAGPFADLASVAGFHVIDEVVDSPRLLESPEELPETLTSGTYKTFTPINASGTLLLDGFVTVVTRDVPAANGVIHIVDGVMVPRGASFPGTTPQALAAYPALSKISDASAATNLLMGVTSTLFAPFNASYGAVPSFNDFVRQHAATSVVRDSATFGIPFTLLNGETVAADTQELTVKGKRIVRPDLITASGVVHIVDGVLMDATADAGVGDAGN